LNLDEEPVLDAPVGKNLIGNYSFEETLEDGWIWQTTFQVLHLYKPGGGWGIKDGEYAVNFWNDTPGHGPTMTFGYYDIGVVPAGKYSYSFYITGGGYGDGEFRMQIFINDKLVCDEAKEPENNGEMDLFSVDIEIGQISKVRIAISIDNKVDLGGAWSIVDLVTFERIE